MSEEIMQAETVESTASAEGTPEAELDVFDSDWDGDGQTNDDDMELEADEATEETAEADQPTAEDAENASQAEDADNTAAEPEQTETAEEKEEDQLFTLKHLDEVREVSRDEVVTLAQKGMDYDRKVGMLTDEINEYKEFLSELCPPNTSIEQMMDLTRARLFKANEEKAGRTISDNEALLTVQKNRADKKAAAKAAAKQEAERLEAEKKQKNNEAIQRFVSVYGDIKPEDIPASVWADAKKDGDLLGAYTRYENKQLKAENTALKQNAKNKARSTGSRKTEGATAAKDPFDAAWDAF